MYLFRYYSRSSVTRQIKIRWRKKNDHLKTSTVKISKINYIYFRLVRVLCVRVHIVRVHFHGCINIDIRTTTPTRLCTRICIHN